MNAVEFLPHLCLMIKRCVQEDLNGLQARAWLNCLNWLARIDVVVSVDMQVVAALGEAAGAIPVQGIQAENDLLLDRRGHIYVDVHWPGVSGRACWDTGSGATIVDRDFWIGHPELFEQIGVSVGTDGNGECA